MPRQSRPAKVHGSEQCIASEMSLKDEAQRLHESSRADAVFPKLAQLPDAGSAAGVPFSRSVALAGGRRLSMSEPELSGL